MNKKDLAKFIDHTNLKPNATEKDIEILCEEALKHGFASVCVNPSMVEKATSLLKGSDVKVCTVIGFPIGATTTKVKAFETRDAIFKGATEIDMVINIGKLKERNFAYVKNDIEAVVDAAKGRALIKVIIETCLLTDEEKIIACDIAREACADFVKTSTGFSTGGATTTDVALMREIVGPNMGVKASGGIKTCEDAMAMIEAGANRIGTSSSVSICNI